MHPSIWIPGIEKYISAYGVMMMLGLLSAILLSEKLGRARGCRPGSFWTLGILGFLSGMLGCRLMYAIHHAPELGLVQAFRMAGGGEILGGVILATVLVALWLKITKRPVRLYLDVAIPGVILAMGIGRLGCFLFGCCWGGICETPKGEPTVPWAVQFPYMSPAWERHHEENLVQCPEELRWYPPVAKGEKKELKPIPREMLRDHVDIHPAYLKLAEATIAVIDTQASNPEDPNLPAMKQKVSRLHKELIQQVGKFKRIDLAMANQIVRLNQYGQFSLDTLRELASKQKSRWIHPAQLYDFFSLVLMSLLLCAILSRRKHHGVVLAWAMIFYSISRFCMEMIRTDNPQDMAGGLTISQAISIGLFVGGWLLLLLFIKGIPVTDTDISPVENNES